MTSFDTAGKSKEDIAFHIVKLRVDAERMEKRKAKHLRNILYLHNDIAMKRAELEMANAAYFRRVYDNAQPDRSRLTFPAHTDFMLVAKIHLDMPRDDPKEVEWRKLCDRERIMQIPVTKIQERIDFKLEMVRILTDLLIGRGDMDDDEESGEFDVSECDADDESDNVLSQRPLVFRLLQ
jgi:hypothetical protein